jgi:hypothetical protein
MSTTDEGFAERSATKRKQESTQPNMSGCAHHFTISYTTRLMHESSLRIASMSDTFLPVQAKRKMQGCEHLHKAR